MTEQGASQARKAAAAARRIREYLQAAEARWVREAGLKPDLELVSDYLIELDDVVAAMLAADREPPTPARCALHVPDQVGVTGVRVCGLTLNTDGTCPMPLSEHHQPTGETP